MPRPLLPLPKGKQRHLKDTCLLPCIFAFLFLHIKLLIHVIELVQRFTQLFHTLTHVTTSPAPWMARSRRTGPHSWAQRSPQSPISQTYVYRMNANSALERLNVGDSHGWVCPITAGLREACRGRGRWRWRGAQEYYPDREEQMKVSKQTCLLVGWRILSLSLILHVCPHLYVAWQVSFECWIYGQHPPPSHLSVR